MHVLIYQVSVDVAVRIKREDGTVVAEVDATNLGWESVPVILHGGGFLRGDGEHAEAAIAASEARRSKERFEFTSFGSGVLCERSC
jgi:hypothetical protein